MTKSIEVKAFDIDHSQGCFTFDLADVEELESIYLVIYVTMQR